MSQKNKTLIIFFLIPFVIIVIAMTIALSSRSSGMAGQIKKGLRAESIKVSQVIVKKDVVTVSYAQPISFKQPELYAVWTYIMATVAKNTTAQKVVIICNFEDGEIIQAEAQIKDAELFIKKEITDEEFLSRIIVKPLTRGPALTE